MIHLHGTVATASASLYMTKLCKHFRHKISVEFDERQARADFPYGHCLMRAEPDLLRFECQAADAESLARMRAVLDDHLPRFSRQEGLVIQWL
ncbi:DUF2218 domain-containing protein [Stutzerimonas kirkiae]|uniref:DUF2218 domain-containing protein n=1 Tax=Stutzerimonas kirkiae TaxID=2211392 RepID=A0A4Q9R393_9GAMM|nr:DUF2218 domain-containing protein [Stutzerimonas kirkiae]TBU94052.1 DUF2218 domain-containing protein [Stutzerimonas kirkiae]TBV06132.1 DUF2218 domain-containing protein [Stutzerimonas kirkiae]TBV06574.1 DUF2218 domain-containing protein [Stutzerimonas kirkiae]